MKEIIELNNISYFYEDSKKPALSNVNLKIMAGEFVGIIGSNGSGKSTLSQVLNGLIQITSGYGRICNIALPIVKKRKNELWRYVGLVMQFPDHQIFSENVFDEIAFGLKNLGCDKVEIKRKVLEIVKLLDIFEFLNQYPFHLSGGQKKLLSIASILVMNPQILVLDEPTIGLDFENQKKLLTVIDNIHKELNVTIVFISHDISQLIEKANRFIILNKGSIVADFPTHEIFENEELLNQHEIILPDIINLAQNLRKEGLKISKTATTPRNLAFEIKNLLKT